MHDNANKRLALFGIIHNITLPTHNHLTMRTDTLRNHTIALASIIALAILGVDIAQAVAIPYGLGLIGTVGVSLSR